MLNGLDLFSGIGGLSIALEPWVRPVAYCDVSKYPRSVLLDRMAAGEIEIAPIWNNVRTLKAKHLPVAIDIITGGFPCQDISVAGDGAGLEGGRSGLFFEIIRLAGELRPRFIFLELTALGFDCRWTIVSAAEMGAVHLRERWFLLGYANREPGGLSHPKNSYSNTYSEPIRKKSIELSGGNHSPKSVWLGDSWALAGAPEGFFEPRVGRAGDGIPNSMDRHAALGNAVVPAQAREAFERLIGFKGGH